MKLEKRDIFLIVLILAIIAGTFTAFLLSRDTTNAKVVIRVDGEVVGTYDLSVDNTIEINGGSNLLEIKDGKANMIEADCPDLLCVHQRQIKENGESIICLPNKVVVEIQSADDSGVDVIAN